MHQPTSIDTEWEPADRTLTITVESRLDLYCAAEIRNFLSHEDAATFLLDLRGAESVEDTGIAVLLVACTSAERRGASVKIRCRREHAGSFRRAVSLGGGRFLVKSSDG